MPFVRSPPEMAHFQWRKWRPLHCNKLIKRPLLKEKENKTKSPFREHRVAFPHDSRGHLEGAKDKEGEREKVTELWTIKAADGKKSHYLRLMIIFIFFHDMCRFLFYGSSCHKMFFSTGSSIVCFHLRFCRGVRFSRRLWEKQVRL